MIAEEAARAIRATPSAKYLVVPEDQFRQLVEDLRTRHGGWFSSYKGLCLGYDHALVQGKPVYNGGREGKELDQARTEIDSFYAGMA